MKAVEKTRHVTDVVAEEDVVRARRPFKVSKEDQRRFIRLEIASPMSMQKVKDGTGNYWPQGDWHIINGMILNISAGGVLLDLDQAVDEGDIVSMHFTLQEVEGLDRILGKVKRTDMVPEGCLAGVEFVTKEFLLDYFSQAEMDLLGDNHTNFDASVRRVLNKYIYKESTLPNGA